MSVYAVNGKVPVAAWIPSRDTVGNGTSTLNDLVGTNHGTLTNMDAATDWVANTSNGGVRALAFDGVNDFVDFGNSSSLTNATGAVSFWLVNKGTNNVCDFIARTPNADTWPVFGIGYESSRMFLSTNNGGSNEPGSTITSYSAVNHGDHFAVSWVGTTAKCYQNGSLIATITRTNAFNNNSTSRTVLARSGEFNNYYFDGQLDDVRLFNVELALLDVAYLYNNGNGRGRIATSSNALIGAAW